MEQAEKRRGCCESRIPVLREVAFNRRWRKRPGALNGKAKLCSENKPSCLEEQLRNSECERDKLTRTVEALSKELARYRNDNELLTAQLAANQSRANDHTSGSVLGSWEQERDAFVEQLVMRVITSQQHALLTQDKAASSSYQGVRCDGEGSTTELSYFDRLVNNRLKAHDVSGQTGSTGGSGQTGSSSLSSPLRNQLHDCRGSVNATFKEEFENLKFRLSSEVEKNAQQASTVQAYQEHYHRCMERCSTLEAQVYRHTLLLGKLDLAMSLKDKALALFRDNISSLDHHTGELLAEREGWKRQLLALTQKIEELTKECGELGVLRDNVKQENEQLLKGYAHCLASWSVQRALMRSLNEEVQRLTAELSSKVIEASDVKRKLAQYHNVFKRSQQEYQETLEFTDAERSSLLQSIKEMESQVQTLQHELREKEAVVSTLKTAELSARELQTSLQLSQLKNSMFNELEVSVRGAYQLFRGLLVSIAGEGQMSRHPESGKEIESSNLGLHLMSVGIDLQRRLQHTSLQTTNVTASNHSNHGDLCYEDLLRENTYLNERITELTHDLEKELEQSKVLRKYTEEYQSNASCKIAILKENVAKADMEIAELDKIVDHAREVMRGDIELIKRSPQLLNLLRELDGNEAPQSY